MSDGARSLGNLDVQENSSWKVNLAGCDGSVVSIVISGRGVATGDARLADPSGALVREADTLSSMIVDMGTGRPEER